MKTKPKHALLELAKFSTTTVATAVAMLELRDPTAGYTGSDVRALLPEFGARVGVAVTARFDSTTPGFDSPLDRLPEWLALMKKASVSAKGHTLPVFAVVEGVGLQPRRTVMGPMIAAHIRLAGAAGLLTNGCVRDLNRLRGLGLACWAAGLAPMHGRMRWLDLNCPVKVDGMTVRPGDYLHADVNGAVVFPADAVERVYEQALAIKKRDVDFYKRMAKPGALDALLREGQRK